MQASNRWPRAEDISVCNKEMPTARIFYVDRIGTTKKVIEL
jgi:hypothetical protein